AEYVPAPRSIFDCIRKLPAAHLAVLDERGFRLHRYWELPVPASADRNGSPAAQARQDPDLQAEPTHLLRASRRRRLSADVPVGVCLSGGVDSTAITAMAARHRRPLETFNVAFDESSFDESPFAELAAQRLGTEHHSETLSSNACLEQVPEAVAQLDEPFADPSFLPTLLLSHFVRRHVIVALAGDGGDELFAGYDPFLAHRPAQIAARLPEPVRALLGKAVSHLPAASTNMSLDFRLKQFFRGLSAPASLRHQFWIGAFVPGE